MDISSDYFLKLVQLPSFQQKSPISCHVEFPQGRILSVMLSLRDYFLRRSKEFGAECYTRKGSLGHSYAKHCNWLSQTNGINEKMPSVGKRLDPPTCTNNRGYQQTRFDANCTITSAGLPSFSANLPIHNTQIDSFHLQVVSTIEFWVNFHASHIRLPWRQILVSTLPV